MPSPSPPNVILYRYDSSPYSHKIDNILVLKNISHYRVQVSHMLPRPEITDLLGINYRRIPILAIENDIYCDTSLIASTLERKFPSSNGFGTLFPVVKNGRSDTGISKIFSKFYVDNTLFPLLVNLLPWDRLPQAFLKDRSALLGGPIDVEAIKANQGKSLSLLASHLALVEEQLSDGREWLLDTELPGLADISVHFMLNWATGISTMPFLDSSSLPFVSKWISRVSSFLQSKQESRLLYKELGGVDAANLIFLASDDADIPGFDTVQAERLNLHLGEDVLVAPDDTGRNYPTAGKLVALNDEEVVIEIKVAENLLRCHFPRLGFTVRPATFNNKL